ncbi:domain of Kin17 curved DNA-binding protein-domain-containing protein [Cercophora newfieldiana]|uniref:Domain of Kin17 curved DNA-binding protein-domain-containing protein n=1 Tax=Cercophora newfieldiana TaxID=92897 RepID=A0AA39YHW1_9PEZI|nr:domain of Kin17 curved DNA-binding protein-domain-containing protein [Cercophora newfieldiana]
MPRAEAGSLKHLSNQMKSKGLTRLRWYCQICEKAARDENAFKMHCQSESHTRKALEVGRDFKGTQETFSKQFESNFVQLLRTAHGEKEVHANKFYQEVIADKTHVHLNSTKWHSLTEFVKHLGRSGTVRVEEKEDGIFIAYMDNSQEAIERREKVRRKEMQDRGDEEREQALLKAQIKRAQKAAAERGEGGDEEEEEEEARAHELNRQEGEKIKLQLGAVIAAKATESVASSEGGSEPGPSGTPGTESGEGEGGKAVEASKPVSMKFGVKPQAKNVFKNAFSGASKKVMAAPPKKMSEAERIMKEEIERKRARESGGGPPSKKMKFQF